jgi:predicted double-glycine peptidase
MLKSEYSETCFFKIHKGTNFYFYSNTNKWKKKKKKKASNRIFKQKCIDINI